jgi:threonine dehydratase
MPKTAVPAKVEAIRGYGAEPWFVENMESVFDEMELTAEARDDLRLAVCRPGCDCGPGVVGLEILEDMPDVENIIVAAGVGA